MSYEQCSGDMPPVVENSGEQLVDRPRGLRKKWPFDAESVAGRFASSISCWVIVDTGESSDSIEERSYRFDEKFGFGLVEPVAGFDDGQLPIGEDSCGLLLFLGS